MMRRMRQMGDKVFDVYITNLGKYNEGYLMGEWVALPTTREELQEVFDRIGINEEYQEIFITDYDIELHGVSEILGEYENVDKLNYLAAVIDDLNRDSREQYEAVLESGLGIGQDGIDGLINLAFNLDKYDLIRGIEDEDDLGRHYADLMYGSEMEGMGGLANYIDYERYGSDCQLDEGGMFTNAGYMRDTGQSWYEYFDGTLEDIPDEYRISGGKEQSVEKITVLVVEPEKKPYVKEIEHTLKNLQNEVEGGIEAVYPFEDRVAIICNDEHKFNGSKLNRCLRDDNGEVYDILAGNFLIAGLTEDNFGSLTPEQIEKFTDYFAVPEMFMKIGDNLMVLPMEDGAAEIQHQQETSQEDIYAIYQLKDGDDMRDYRFSSIRDLERMGLSVNPEHYEKVYEAPKNSEDTLDSIYMKFNMEHPADFRGHSLSVSDIVVFHENGVDTAHYVDSFGFKAVPEFLAAKDITVDMDTAGLTVEGHDGTWHSIEELAVHGETYYLMESEAFGQDANMIVVDHAGKLIAEDITAVQRADVREIVVGIIHQNIEDTAAVIKPDCSITTEEMKSYGYDWNGMLPVKEQNAGKLHDAGLEMFALHKDGTEASLDSKEAIAEHAANGGIFGVEKVQWAKFIETNSLKTVEELLEDDYGMIDGIINNGVKEDKDVKNPEKKESVIGKLSEHKEAVAKHEKESEKEKPKSHKAERGLE
jgi:hypothetical protein